MDRLTPSDVAELSVLCPGGLLRDVDLSAISQWGIGGPADLMVAPSSTEEVAALMRWFSDRDIQPVVIGLTSNLLFDDAGLRAPCIQIGARMARTRIAGADVYAAAGVWVPGLARQLMQSGLGGAEHICGIPGTLGGLICMNGGSQRQGIGSVVVTVESVDTTGEIQQRLALDCGFAYRRSVYQSIGEIITAVHLRLTPRPRNEIRSEMRKILAGRRLKFPRKDPNCGSVFKSNPEMYDSVGPPGAVIDSLGLKGLRIGDAQCSPRHSNFIVNLGSARAHEVLMLISMIGDAVKQETGYQMESEVIYIAPNGNMLPAYGPSTERQIL